MSCRAEGRQSVLRCDAFVGEIRDVVIGHADEIKGLLARRHALNIKVFGSVARGEDRQDSDVDFLVEFEPGSSLLDLIYLEESLRELLRVSVDVVSAGALLERDDEILRDLVPL